MLNKTTNRSSSGKNHVRVLGSECKWRHLGHRLNVRKSDVRLCFFLHFTCHLWARAFKPDLRLLCLVIYKMQKYHIYPITTAASLFPRSRWQLQNKYPWLWITGLRCWPCICVSLETISPPPPPHISSNLSAVRCLQRDKKSPEIIKEIKIVSKHHPNINSRAPKNALFFLIDETFHYSYPVTW